MLPVGDSLPENYRGVVQSFGVFQSVYEDSILREYSASQISWIGTTQACLIIAIGVLTGPFFDHGHLRPILLLGSFLTVSGTMMLSLSTEYYQIILSQGVCIGLGNGLVYVPSLALVASAFDSKKRSLALGVVAARTSIGGLFVVYIALRLLIYIYVQEE